MNASTRADIAYPAIGATRLRGLRDPVEPHVIVLFGATGDLSRRKLLPGLTYLALSALTPDIQVVGTSLDDHGRRRVPGVRPRRPCKSSAPAR